MRPPVSQDVMSATEAPVPAARPGQATTEAARPVPADSTAPKAQTKKAPAKKTPTKQKKAASKVPAPEPTTPESFTVMQVDPDAIELTVPKQEHDAWDDFGDFWGAFNPFMASLSALPPEFHEWKEDVIEQYAESTPPEREDMVEELEEVLPVLTDSVGDTPQPDRYEQLKPIELPPILTPSTEEAPSTSA
ncbi:hypothetical protein [Streptomyces microflavus]|uniref:hypothetical protein n=1 Tax=Streptomyces microflavus TaxID=1919 RepID=UPI0036E9B9DC